MNDIGVDEIEEKENWKEYIFIYYICIFISI